MDSSGVHIVIDAVQQSAEQDTCLMIVPGPPAVHRVFEICDLADRMPFVTDS